MGTAPGSPHHSSNSCYLLPIVLESLTSSSLLWPPIRVGIQRAVSLLMLVAVGLPQRLGNPPNSSYVDSLAFKGERSHGNQGRETKPSKKKFHFNDTIHHSFFN